MKYICLKDNFGLRGWDRLPYGIMDFQTGKTVFLNKEQWNALEFCTGDIDVSNIDNIAPREFENNIREALRHGFLEELEYPRTLRSYQKYKKSDCRYINSIQWSVTGRCNLRCRHCYVNAPDALHGELPLDECIKAINQFEEANIGEVSITGGEPLVRKDFWDIVDALLEKKIAVNDLYTNGLLADGKFLAECGKRNLKLRFCMSFDGVERHDWLRGVPGTESKTIDAIRLIREHGHPVMVSTTLHGENIDSLMKTYELLKNLGAETWKTSPVINTGNWKTEPGKKDVEIKNLYDAYLDLISAYSADNMPLTIMLGGFYYSTRGGENQTSPYQRFDGTEKALNQPVCGSCRTHLYLLPDGRLMPCIPMCGTYVEEKAPNIFDTPLTEILSESSALFAMINTRLREMHANNPVCGKCEFKLKCGGGCRAEALQSGGGLHGVDESACFFWKNNYREKIRRTVENIKKT